LKRRVLLTLSYLTVALFVTALWTFYARTESLDELAPTEQSTGQTTKRYSSIIGLVEGTTINPFVKRRLFPELTAALSAIVPPALCTGLDNLINGDSIWSPPLRYVALRIGWKREHYPLLISAFVVMWFSAAGFMFTCRWLVNHFYRTPSWLASAAGASFGLALLGGNGDWHYFGYPYDFPQAFLFALTLAGMLARQCWFILSFALAAYSKETSVLLIAGYLLLAEDWRSLKCWATAGIMTAIFLAIRHGIDLRFPTGPNEFWCPIRNIKRLVLLLFFCWYWPFLGVAFARFVSRHREYPLALKRLSLLAVPLVGAAFFKGWIEEMRQYLELLPIAGLMVLQWILHEAGFGWAFQPHGQPRLVERDDKPESVPPPKGLRLWRPAA